MRNYLSFLLFLGSVFCLSPGRASAVAPVRDFSYYQIILDKKPFGEVVAPGAAQEQNALGEAILKELELKGIVDDGQATCVKLFDKKTNKYVSIGLGENYDGIQLVSVNYDDEEAVLKRGAETAVIKCRPDKAQPPGLAAGPAAIPPFSPQLAAVPANMPSPFSFTNAPAPGGGRRPFFSDLRNRRMSPFQPLGTNTMPFQGKPLSSFFKATTGAFPQAQSPFSIQQQEGANPSAFQQFMQGASNASNPFMSVAQPQVQTAPAAGQAAPQEQQMQQQSMPVTQNPFQPVQYQEQLPVEAEETGEIEQ